MSHLRLDQILVNRGLAPSRERAQSLILAGHVTVDGQLVSKSGTPINVKAEVQLIAPDHPYVGRGGIKLAHALDKFTIKVNGCYALDIGASTGGFTDVLLQRGAEKIVALDVGHGQLDWTLRNNSRVVVIEGVNAKTLKPSDVPGPFDLIVIDVSFISLTKIFPVLPPLLKSKGEVIALVKPQFEAERAELRKGIIRESSIHERILDTVTNSAAEVGLLRTCLTPSPITGAKGNQEFFLCLHQ